MPTAAVKIPVPVTIDDTDTGADCVVTWKVVPVGLIAYKSLVPNSAVLMGHAGVPPPVATVTVAGTVVKTTRCKLMRRPMVDEVKMLLEYVAVSRAAPAVVTMKEFKVGLRTNNGFPFTNWPRLRGHAGAPPPANKPVSDEGATPK
jgi:hypothetical protein